MIHNKMSLKALLYCSLAIALTSCEKISSIFEARQQDDSLYMSIQGMYADYNKKDLNAYTSYFADEINVFKENGLGNTRIISGKENLKDYYKRIFQTKRTLKITPLEHFTVYPWIMVKELIELEEQIFEAAVGYRLQNGKIRDRMILSENFLVNKEKLSIELPKEKKSNELVLPPPHASPASGDKPAEKPVK